MNPRRELIASLGRGIMETSHPPLKDRVLREEPVGIETSLLIAARDEQIKTIRLTLIRDVALDALIERTIVGSTPSHSVEGKMEWLETRIEEPEAGTVGIVVLEAVSAVEDRKNDGEPHSESNPRNSLMKGKVRWLEMNLIENLGAESIPREE